MTEHFEKLKINSPTYQRNKVDFLIRANSIWSEYNKIISNLFKTLFDTNFHSAKISEPIKTNGT